MSRILKIMVALLAIALIAVPAFAEDRLTLTGSYDIFGLYTNNTDFDDSVLDTASNFNQRFRLGGTIAVAEGVAIKFRADIAEGDFGDNPNAGNPAINFDDAYIQWDTDMLQVKAGMHYIALGKGIAVEDRSSGFTLLTKTAVPVQLTYHKEVEDAEILGIDKDSDVEIWQAQVSHKTDMYSTKVFVAYENNETVADMNQYVVGVSADFDLGAVLLTGEFDFFGGDAGANTDAKGLQLFLDASAPLNDTFTLGGMFFYAKGYDDADEDQLTHISDRNADWMPQEYGPNSTDFGFVVNIFDYVSDVANNAGLPGAPNIDANAGIIAGAVYVSAKVSDDLLLTGNVMYATPEEDGHLGGVDFDTTFVTLGSEYKLFANTTLASSIHYMDVADGDDAAIGAITYLSVKF
ncbi:MAG: hypothetical protein KAT62_12885 [Desulfuromonadales bacterium]|nr:hypothetical protein [Desulfuromonadales bacterium]